MPDEQRIILTYHDLSCTTYSAHFICCGQRMLSVSDARCNAFQHATTMPNYGPAYFTGNTLLLLNVHILAYVKGLA